jgi:uncharacterized protein (DUF58 family)
MVFALLGAQQQRICQIIMKQKLANWLETRWVRPSYAGRMLSGLAVFFLAAATNTMVGWLYVISGVSLALLGFAAALPLRSLQPLTIRRRPIAEVSAGEELTVELEIANPTAQPKMLLQVLDILPESLGQSAQETIESIPAGGTHRWVYYSQARQRGIYHWQEVQLRTATPLGLFWCRRSRVVPAKAIVYPTILPLDRCPLLDTAGSDRNPLFQHRDRQSQLATEGLTRTLRPYRSGDPIRLIHWRSSARYGDLRVRELEVLTSGQAIVIGLDNTGVWNSDDFEQAAIAAASLFVYANKRQLNVQFWSATTGIVRGHHAVLEALAAIAFGDSPRDNLPQQSCIWLTCNPNSLHTLPDGSRWILWPTAGDRSSPLSIQGLGLAIDSEKSLHQQLQAPLI